MNTKLWRQVESSLGFVGIIRGWGADMSCVGWAGYGYFSPPLDGVSCPRPNNLLNSLPLAVLALRFVLFVSRNLSSSVARYLQIDCSISSKS